MKQVQKSESLSLVWEREIIILHQGGEENSRTQVHQKHDHGAESKGSQYKTKKVQEWETSIQYRNFKEHKTSETFSS